jgi:hypothetical protein
LNVFDRWRFKSTLKLFREQLTVEDGKVGDDIVKYQKIVDYTCLRIVSLITAIDIEYRLLTNPLFCIV